MWRVHFASSQDNSTRAWWTMKRIASMRGIASMMLVDHGFNESSGKRQGIFKHLGNLGRIFNDEEGIIGRMVAINATPEDDTHAAKPGGTATIAAQN
jgi:hypothetical protein